MIDFSNLQWKWGREAWVGKPLSSGKRTLLSALVLAGSLYNAFSGLWLQQTSRSGSDAIDGFLGGVTLGLSFALWFMGLRGAGRGWRRMPAACRSAGGSFAPAPGWSQGWRARWAWPMCRKTATSGPW